MTAAPMSLETKLAYLRLCLENRLKIELRLLKSNKNGNFNFRLLDRIISVVRCSSYHIMKTKLVTSDVTYANFWFCCVDFC